MKENYRVIDISQPVGKETACFPGDTPFSKTVTVSYADSKVINLTAFTMSPHVGTHADAPVHVQGDMAGGEGMASDLSLLAFVGPAFVMDLSPLKDAITPDHVRQRLSSLSMVPSRVLFKTAGSIRYDVFEESYAYFSEGVVALLSGFGVRLVGIDTPSVDHIASKTLGAHRALISCGMSWLENLDLTAASEGEYFLIALPLKMTELEASPVRAVLLSGVDAIG